MKIIVYDDTDLSRTLDIDGDGNSDVTIPGLSYAWRAGAALFKTMGRFDITIGVSSWDQFFERLLDIGSKTPICEIQFWGHGGFGSFYLNGVASEADSLGKDRRWTALRRVMQPGHLWWFRTCCTFGTDKGQNFAERWARFFRGRVAGHTAIIGTWGVHSHGHVLQPGKVPHWQPTDGMREQEGKMIPVNSKPWLPNTISCLQTVIPLSWASPDVIAHENRNTSKRGDC